MGRRALALLTAERLVPAAGPDVRWPCRPAGDGDRCRRTVIRGFVHRKPPSRG
ncbi:hypothetical protein ACFQ3Z_34415 [Streptomyces nogalater]